VLFISVWTKEPADKKENEMKMVLSFFVGAVVGAAAALMFAPSSGEDLRAQMQAEADARTQKFHADWQQGMDGMHVRMDKIQTDISQMSQKDAPEA
jgi:gas vesicle protein